MSIRCFLDIGISLIDQGRDLCLWSTFSPYLLVSGAGMQEELEKEGSFEFLFNTYNGFERVLRNYNFLPTFIFPICTGNHWGYIIVIPNDKGR